jgi:glutathione synthase/RimK-type ligase-like ATP-grasp enzyme
MPARKFHVQVSPGSLEDDVLVLGESVLKKSKMPLRSHVVLQFGAFRQPVRVALTAKQDGIRIGQGLARKMGLVADGPLRLRYRTETGTLALGPLIGVLVSRESPHLRDRPFGAITAFCRELTTACRQQGAYVYFFTPQGIGSSPGWVEGWLYSGEWRRLRLPAPDVLNNRLTQRRLESQANVQQFMRELKRRYGGHVFNEKFLDKTEVFEALGADVALRRHLPESRALRGFATLRHMLAKHPVVFLKPARGSLGKGIIRLARIGPDRWQASFTTASGIRTVTYPSLTRLFHALAGKIKSVRYLAQQGLNLIEVEGRPVDFRVLTQKNASGQWTVTSVVARIASGQQYVSNVARGGTLSQARSAIARSNLPAARRRNATVRLRQAALDIARGLDNRIPAHFGELGIDLAMDTDGRVWLLEVNSKPSKNDNTSLREGQIRPSVRMMVQYARYLSGF